MHIKTTYVLRNILKWTQRIKTLCLTFFFLYAIFSAGVINAQQTACKNTIENEYLLYLPKLYEQDQETNYPLLIFLHGVGERGTDIEKVKTHGPPKLIEKGMEFPFIVVSPQAQGEWINYDIYNLVQKLKEEYAVDPDRIYLTGIGYGVWDLAMQYPQLFAAIAPVCGGGEVSRAWRLRHTAVWSFHGALDDVVPVEASSLMIDAVRKLNANVRFSLLPDVKHDSWIQAYEQSNLYDWLLKQKRFNYKEKQLTNESLSKYSGKYVGSDNTILHFFVKDNALWVKTGYQREKRLKAFSENSFFDAIQNSTEFIFEVDAQNYVIDVQVMGLNHTRYKKYTLLESHLSFFGK